MGLSEVDAVSVFTPKELMDGFDEDQRDRLFRTFVTNNYHYHLQVRHIDCLLTIL